MYWGQRAARRLGNRPQGNQESVLAKDEVGGRLVSKYVERDIFSSSVLTRILTFVENET